MASLRALKGFLCSSEVSQGRMGIKGAWCWPSGLDSRAGRWASVSGPGSSLAPSRSRDPWGQQGQLMVKGSCASFVSLRRLVVITVTFFMETSQHAVQERAGVGPVGLVASPQRSPAESC